LYLDETRKTFLNLRYDKEIEESSLALSFTSTEAGSGCGFSAMCRSMAAAIKESYLYCLKEFHTLVPENEIQLGKIFGILQAS
jgi:hypothetical protein